MNRIAAGLTGPALLMGALLMGALLMGASPAAAAEINLFISPAGQPFTAPTNEPYPIVMWFKGADKNGDGKLDKAEHRADAEAFFAILDRNKDGYVAGQEVTIYEHYMVPEILSEASGGLIRVVLQDTGDNAGDDSGVAPRQRLNTTQGAVQFSLTREPEPVRAADRNFDYRVSLQEFRDHADRHFDALDLNGDGFLTLDELPKTMAERAAHARRN